MNLEAELLDGAGDLVLQVREPRPALHGPGARRAVNRLRGAGADLAKRAE